jgi:hypothetical protein
MTPTPPREGEKPAWEIEPPDDLKAAGKSMIPAECSEMLACIAAILDERLLNGSTHAQMLRWKIRQYESRLAELERENGARERVIQNIVYAIEQRPLPHADMAENGIVQRAVRGVAFLTHQLSKKGGK